jgi:hypothetical protein
MLRFGLIVVVVLAAVYTTCASRREGQQKFLGALDQATTNNPYIKLDQGGSSGRPLRGHALGGGLRGDVGGVGEGGVGDEVMSGAAATSAAATSVGATGSSAAAASSAATCDGHK